MNVLTLPQMLYTVMLIHSLMQLTVPCDVRVCQRLAFHSHRLCVLQILVHDAVNLHCIWSHVTYPAPCTWQLLHGEVCHAGTAVPLALGPRWLSFASNVSTYTGLTSKIIKLSSSLEKGIHIAKAAAKQSTKQLRVLGEAGLKYISSQYEQWMQNGHDTSSLSCTDRDTQVTNP